MLHGRRQPAPSVGHGPPELPKEGSRTLERLHLEQEPEGRAGRRWWQGARGQLFEFGEELRVTQWIRRIPFANVDPVRRRTAVSQGNTDDRRLVFETVVDANVHSLHQTLD